jgi:nicotinamidase-related amidase
MEYNIINDKKTAIINVVVDPQKGFHQFDLPVDKGGVLYVPNGHEIVQPIGKLVNNSRNSIFLISNDWHPKNHFADMTQHPGVMEHRKKLLKALSKNSEMIMNPLELPFTELVFDKHHNIIGVLGEGKRIHKVKLETPDGSAPSAEHRGRVVEVYDEYLDETLEQIVGSSTQALWPPHCVQATESARMEDGLNFPKGLIEQLDSNYTKLRFEYNDVATGNRFYVIRKGINSEMDSLGALIENDRKTYTPAEVVLRELADEMRGDGVEHVIVNYMGLATNFCVEYSGNQIGTIGDGILKISGMTTEHNLVLEACRGIPIPGDKEVQFSLDGTLGRLKDNQPAFDEITVNQILALQKPGNTISGDIRVGGGHDKQQAVG